jgi:hypothetical protein
MLELAQQAGLKKTHGSDREYMGDFDWREFAELMVRECVKVMYDNAIERRVPPDINKTPAHYAVAVLKHFGIES